jgi:hypothetical protein
MMTLKPMAHGEASEVIAAPSHAVFDLIRDYCRRVAADPCRLT